jgi:hypothetical protein
MVVQVEDGARNGACSGLDPMQRRVAVRLGLVAALCNVPHLAAADSDAGDRHRHDGRCLLCWTQRDPHQDEHHPVGHPLQG